MRLKRILIIGTIFPVLFSIVLFFGILISGEDDDSSNSYSPVYSGMNLSADVLKHQPTATEKELAYYVKDGVLAPVSGDYVFSELENPVFTKDGDNLKVSVSVKYLDNKSKTTQISQYEFVLHKDDNWKIIR